jgi:hypothetical protein
LERAAAAPNDECRESAAARGGAGSAAKVGETAAAASIAAPPPSQSMDGSRGAPAVMFVCWSRNGWAGWPPQRLLRAPRAGAGAGAPLA